jgi:hypothetical protein
VGLMIGSIVHLSPKVVVEDKQRGGKGGGG